MEREIVAKFFDGDMTSLGLYAYLMANVNDGVDSVYYINNCKVTLSAGQCATTWRRLCQETGLSFFKIKKVIKRLTEAGLVLVRLRQRYILLTVNANINERKCSKQSSAPLEILSTIDKNKDNNLDKNILDKNSSSGDSDNQTNLLTITAAIEALKADLQELKKRERPTESATSQEAKKSTARGRKKKSNTDVAEKEKKAQKQLNSSYQDNHKYVQIFDNLRMLDSCSSKFDTAEYETFINDLITHYNLSIPDIASQAYKWQLYFNEGDKPVERPKASFRNWVERNSNNNKKFGSETFRLLPGKSSGHIQPIKKTAVNPDDDLEGFLQSFGN